MGKRSVLAKLLLVVAIALILPSMLGALDVACEPAYCQSACPAGQYDCTTDWVFDSWANFQTACATWYAGYSLLICCWS
ncbi:MAG: hypothetical protein RL328_813 [Acidobacteriota bacterium]